VCVYKGDFGLVPSYFATPGAKDKMGLICSDLKSAWHMHMICDYKCVYFLSMRMHICRQVQHRDANMYRKMHIHTWMLVCADYKCVYFGGIGMHICRQVQHRDANMYPKTHIHTWMLVCTDYKCVYFGKNKHMHTRAAQTRKYVPKNAHTCILTRHSTERLPDRDSFRLPVCMCVRMFVCYPIVIVFDPLYVCAYVYMYVYMYICVCVGDCYLIVIVSTPCIYIYIYIYIHTHTQTHRVRFPLLCMVAACFIAIV
jgi:hypothetical protein